ncbi:MAG: hypothetical protein KUG68_03985 [Flavobacteriaceae bacterium]|nr:hypothetical protein [Flavobacteriaceae bacterium]
MKIIKFITLAMSTVLFIACSKEDVESIKSAHLEQIISEVSIKDQIPQLQFDDRKEGVYLGIITSTTTLKRGKIWINAGNDTHYNVIVEIEGGAEYKLHLESSSNQIPDTTIFNFSDAENYITLDVTNIDSPILLDAFIEDEHLSSYIVKVKNGRRAFAWTGIYHSPANPNISGTWNMITDGTPAPSQFNGWEIVSAAAVTYQGVLRTDTSMEDSDFTCFFGVPTFIKPVSSADQFFVWGQTSNFPATVSWSVGYILDDIYYNDNCTGGSSGLFSMRNGTITGEIYID